MPTKKKPAPARGMGPRKLTEGEAEVLAEQLLRERSADALATRILGKQHHFEQDVAQELRAVLEANVFLDRIVEAIKKHQPRVAPVQIPGAQAHEDEMGLLFSDLQLGTAFTRAQTGNLAGYSSSLAECRVRMLAERIAAIQKVRKHKRLNLFLAGDLVEGTEIYPGQPFHVDAHSVEQTLHCGDLLTEFTRAMAGIFPSVHAIGVLGNHGRSHRDAPVSSNLDLLAMKLAEAKTSQQKNLTWKIETESWFSVVELQGGRRVLVVHGDDLSMSLPGMEKYVQRWKAMVGRLDYVLVGHHHRFTVVETGETRLIVNGSFVGGSEYSLKKMGLNNAPGQVAFGLDRQGRMTWMEQLSLETQTRRPRVVRAA